MFRYFVYISCTRDFSQKALKVKNKKMDEQKAKILLEVVCPTYPMHFCIWGNLLMKINVLFFLGFRTLWNPNTSSYVGCFVVLSWRFVLENRIYQYLALYILSFCKGEQKIWIMGKHVNLVWVYLLGNSIPDFTFFGLEITLIRYGPNWTRFQFYAMWCHMTLWDKKLKVVTSGIFILSLEVDIFLKK